MPAPYPKQQTRARALLEAIIDNPSSARIIHYSCESFSNRPDGRSPRITSIAVRRVDSGATESFSIHLVAERNGVALAGIEADFDRLERIMLDEYYAYVKRSGEVTYVHWNMRDANYGFAAIEHRYSVLGGAPERIAEGKRVDLSALFQQIYGSEYIEDPKMQRLAELNDITTEGALPGAEEPELFARKAYVELHQSTLRKTDILHSLAESARYGTLRTNASWWVLHGGSLRGVWMWLVTNQSWRFIVGLPAAIVLVAAVVKFIIGIIQRLDTVPLH